MNEYKKLRAQVWADIYIKYCFDDQCTNPIYSANSALDDFDAKFPASYFKDEKSKPKTGGVWLTDDEFDDILKIAKNCGRHIGINILLNARNRGAK